MNLSDIKRPTLLVDKLKVIRNIEEMKQKADNNGIILRPHFKTHQSYIIGELFRNRGIDRITVSSVQMAEYFSRSGWKDITIAFPLNMREIDDINKLSGKLELNILISSKDHIKDAAKKLGSAIGFYIKIDTGYHRCGLEYNQLSEINEILTIGGSNASLKFRGFLSHFGNTYKVESEKEILQIYEEGKDRLNQLKLNFIDRFPDTILSVGDTPSCSIVRNFEGIDEIRPGNFVYYDLTQQNIGSCSIENIAVAVACPVIEKNTRRNELLIYGGAVHLSKDFTYNNDKSLTYGTIVRLNETGWIPFTDGSYLKSISQEHGQIHANQEVMSEINEGDLIGVLPAHSCLTANLLKKNTLYF